MKNKCRIVVISIELLILGLLVVTCIFLAKTKKQSLRSVYNNYEITVKDSVYYEGTQTGKIDLQIKTLDDKSEKLLYTEHNIFNNGSFKLWDEEIQLQVQEDPLVFRSEAYEGKSRGGTQHITIYYINQDLYGEVENIRLVLKEIQTKEELLSMTIDPDIDKKVHKFKFYNQTIYLTANGIMMSVGTEQEMYGSISVQTGIMMVKWKDRSEKIAMNTYAETAEYSPEDIIIPEVRWGNDLEQSNDRRYYVVELDDWEEIEEIQIGSYIFERED